MLFEKDNNTYMDIEEANAIISDEFGSDSEEAKLWDTLDDLGKKRLIVKYTRITDKLPYLGTKMYGEQPLKWPRVIKYKYQEVPYDVKVGILAQGIKDKLEKVTEEYKLKEKGIKNYAIKGASITFTDNVNNKVLNGLYEEIFNEYFIDWVY